MPRDGKQQHYTYTRFENPRRRRRRAASLVVVFILLITISFFPYTCIFLLVPGRCLSLTFARRMFLTMYGFGILLLLLLLYLSLMCFLVVVVAVVVVLLVT
jgi:hypothetical protein